MSDTYSVCAFCGAQHHDTITTPCCLAQANCQLAEAQARIKELENFKPTPDQVNALPEGIRKYVHDLSSSCDPAGIVAENILVRDLNTMLSTTHVQLEAKLAEAENELFIRDAVCSGTAVDIERENRMLTKQLAEAQATIERQFDKGMEQKARIKELENELAR